MESTHFPISHWAEDDRPREKLLLKGKGALSDAELIAILIGSGSRKESAVDLSRRIISSVGTLNALGKLSVAQLTSFRGIGEAKAITIIAALELGRRRRAEEPLKNEIITSSQEVFAIMQPILGELPHEEFWVLLLNNSNKVMHKLQLSKGGITGTVVDVRLLFKTVIESGVTSIILVHNHPSGTLVPSEADISMTQKIKGAGESLDVKILDHLIITESNYYSFADQGIL